VGTGKILLEVRDICAAWDQTQGSRARGSTFSLSAELALLKPGGSVLLLPGVANHEVTKTFLHLADFSHQETKTLRINESI